MKSIITAASFLLFFNSVVNGQAYQWANAATGDGFEQALAMACDDNNNVVITGQIEFITSFGSVDLEAAGIHDIYLAKYNSAGQLLWAKRAGGRDGDKAQAIAIDQAGNIYITGEFEDTSNFDAIQLITRGSNNTFVAKYDPNGNVQWVRSFGTDSLSTRGYSITCDRQGNVYVGGATQHNVYYNNNLIFTTHGGYDAFIAKFDTDGNLGWIRQVGGPDSDKIYGLTVDSTGHIYATGYFAGGANFGPGVTLPGYGRTDMFLAKYDTAGNIQWARQAGDTSHDRGWSVIVNHSGEVIVAGEFNRHGKFGSLTAYSNGNADAFLAAYDDNGNPLWVVSAGGPEEDVARAVSNDSYGNLYISGDFADVAHFGGPVSLTSNGFADVFVASYDAGGNLIFAKGAGGNENDRGRDICVDMSDNVYTCGEFFNSIDFDGFHLTGDTLSDIFVSRLSSGQAVCGVTATVTAHVSCYSLCDGRALATGSGEAPLSFQWTSNPPQATDQALNLCAGTYTVTMSDAIGCTASATVTVNEPAQIQVAATITDATCTGCSDGEIDLSVSSGTAPYTFVWSNGESSEDISGLEAGDYSVCVQDDNGCVECDSFSVSEPPVGLYELLSETGITVYPNPVTTSAQVVFDNSKSQEWTFTLYTGSGATVWQKTVSGPFYFHREDLAAGIYYYEMSPVDSGNNFHGRLSIAD